MITELTLYKRYRYVYVTYQAQLTIRKKVTSQTVHQKLLWGPTMTRLIIMRTHYNAVIFVPKNRQIWGKLTNVPVRIMVVFKITSLVTEMLCCRADVAPDDRVIAGPYSISYNTAFQ